MFYTMDKEKLKTLIKEIDRLIPVVEDLASLAQGLFDDLEYIQYELDNELNNGQ